MKETITWFKIPIMKVIEKIAHFVKLLGLFLSLVIVVSCDKTGDGLVFQQDDLISIAAFLEENQETYSRFYDIMVLGDLENAFSAYNPYGNGLTLFLPTNESFDRFIENSDQYNSFDDLLNDLDFVRLIGRYHMVNSIFRTNDFPYGALPDTTASGDLLTIGFSSDLDSTVYKVNNTAPIIMANMEMVNGYIHIIDEVLEPIRYTGYERLRKDPGYSIISDAFDITGLKDTLGLYVRNSDNQLVKNNYTLLVEHDSIFERNGIHSIDDLINTYATPGRELTDPENGLYQFAAYHILEGRYFLDGFSGSQNYNTYAIYPTYISAGLDLRINVGADTFGIEITDTDTTYINYIRIFYQESNILTKNGPIHKISDVMELYKPGRSQRTFQFLEESEIKEASITPGTYEFIEPEEFELIKWSGVEELVYFKSSGSISASLNDYLRIDGDFIIEYKMPKILPGKYKVSINTDALSNANSTIQVFLDDKRLGGNFNLTTGGSAGNSMALTEIGTVDFSSYREHTIKLRSLIPGVLIWDYVRFDPL